jgi:hypothetical protein
VDPFSGVASSLLRSGLPAVIGMQTEITDEAAITFSDRLYTALAQGFPIDAALAQARRAIFAAGRDVEFGTPVLFMRVADGRLFDVSGAPPPPPVGRVEASLAAEPAAAEAGDAVTWRIRIHNAGSSELSDVIARDTDGETRTGPLALGPGAVHEATWQQTVQSDVDECATVGGRGADGRLVSAQARAQVRVGEARRRVRDDEIAPHPDDGPNWGRIAGIATAALLLVGVLLAVAGVFSGGGGGTKAEFTAFPTKMDVGDLDARGDKVAFLAAAPGSPDLHQIVRLDLGHGPINPVSPAAAKYSGVDVGQDANDHAKLVYSRTDEAGAYRVFMKPFGDKEQGVVAPIEGCNDLRPSMWASLILFAREGPACTQRGLLLKPRGSSELKTVAGANFGADMNDGKIVWRADPRQLVARKVTEAGEVTPNGSLELPGGEAFQPPLVVEGNYVYFVHNQNSQDFIARTGLPLGESPIEHYVQSDNDNGAEEAPHFGVTADKLYITNYPQRNGDPGTRMVMQVRNPNFEAPG